MLEKEKRAFKTASHLLRCVAVVRFIRLQARSRLHTSSSSADSGSLLLLFLSYFQTTVFHSSAELIISVFFSGEKISLFRNSNAWKSLFFSNILCRSFTRILCNILNQCQLVALLQNPQGSKVYQTCLDSVAKPCVRADVQC